LTAIIFSFRPSSLPSVWARGVNFAILSIPCASGA
jgi:hypothetical protein